MPSRRKAERKFARWVQYYRRYDPESIVAPGMLRAYNAAAIAQNRNVRLARHRITRLIEASSFGTPGARALRRRASPDVVQRTLARARELKEESDESRQAPS